jgi:hypothetical protein
MPQKRGGGFGNLGEAIRRMQARMPKRKAAAMGMPGGTPGFYDNMREYAIRRLQEQGGMEHPTYSQKRSFSARASTDGRSPLFQPNHFWSTYSSRR